MTCEQFRIDGPELHGFGPEQIEILEKFAIGQLESSSSDGVDLGFLAGGHLFDVKFDLEKNIINDALHCALRIDTNKIPAALRKAWLQMELSVLAAENTSGRPTKAQRQQAQEAVDARCEEELKSLKYRRMQQFPVLWDRQAGIFYCGSSSPAAGEQCTALFEQAFGLTLERVTSGKLAEQWADEAKRQEALAETVPSVFQEQNGKGEIAWLTNEPDNFDFLGNEFLLWLWWHLQTESDTLALADGSEVTAMLARTLTLECPRGESGKETITAESPVQLPEARQAIRSGKLPRKSGLILVRNGEQYEFVLQAETFAIGGAKIQLDESGVGRGRQEDRIEGVRHLSETLALLFGAFCERRIGKAWSRELEQIRRWLQQEKSASKKPAA
jgi:hypothetical protein